MERRPRAARRAPAAATSRRRSAGSLALTPNSIVVIDRVSTSAPATPSADPEQRHRSRPRAARARAPAAAIAPSAIRTPISRVRCVDQVRHHAVEPGRSQAPGRRRQTPTTSTKLRRRGAIESPIRSSIADERADRRPADRRSTTALRISGAAAGGIAGRADDERHRPREACAERRESLALRQVRRRIGVRVEPFVARVADDADDLAPPSSAAPMSIRWPIGSSFGQ